MPEPIQRTIALLGLIVIAPLLAVLAILIRISSPGPSLFRADRVSPGGTFTCLKLRTMRIGTPGQGPGITLVDDPRITRLGVTLRRTRLDELPQLWNVVRGEMLLVGPRPEDPRFVDRCQPLHAFVFAHKPGITGITQLVYADEARSLGGADPERRYRDEILPRKLALDARYLRARSARLDAWILTRTVGAVLGRPPSSGEIERKLGKPSGQGEGDGVTGA